MFIRKSSCDKSTQQSTDHTTVNTVENLNHRPNTSVDIDAKTTYNVTSIRSHRRRVMFLFIHPVFTLFLALVFPNNRKQLRLMQLHTYMHHINQLVTNFVCMLSRLSTLSLGDAETF